MEDPVFLVDLTFPADPQAGIRAASNFPGKPQSPADFDFFRLCTAR